MKNTEKRLAVKWIRDKAKSAYTKLGYCQICHSTKDLDLHHYVSVDLLWAKWKKDHSVSDEDVLNERDRFIEENYDNLYNKVVTLCKTHHKKLHSIFGEAPLFSTSEKQQRWVKRMCERNGFI